MVDKVFADWQKNTQSESPQLDTERIIQPFGSEEYNKYTLTNIPPAKTLDFESNLCYCYDCDLEQDFSEVKLPERTGESGGQPIFEARFNVPEPSYSGAIIQSSYSELESEESEEYFQHRPKIPWKRTVDFYIQILCRLKKVSKNFLHCTITTR